MHAELRAAVNVWTVELIEPGRAELSVRFEWRACVPWQILEGAKRSGRIFRSGEYRGSRFEPWLHRTRQAHEQLTRRTPATGWAMSSPYLALMKRSRIWG